MARAAKLFNGFFKALLFVGVFLLASATPSRSATTSGPDFREPPAPLMSLQDQCLERAERSSRPDRMRAICIGWALLAVERAVAQGAKVAALEAECLREVKLGGASEIREFRRQGEAMCRNFTATLVN